MSNLIAGGRSPSGSSVFKIDALDSFAASPEASAKLVFITREISPLGNGGDCLFKRLYITVAHRGYLPSITITPVIDGQALVETKRVIEAGDLYSQDGPTVHGSLEVPPEHVLLQRNTYQIPLAKYLRDEVGRVVGTTGVRGSTLQLRFESDEPGAYFYLEAAELHVVAARASKGDKTLPAGPRE